MQIDQNFFQQGDVLIRKIDSLPENLKQVSAGPKGFVLREGEVTGHAHRVDVSQFTDVDTDFELFEDSDGTMYFKSDIECVVTHEEHGPQTIPAGIHKVGAVQEYNHLTEESEAVKD